MLYLVSPIPPAKTGTANYFKLFLETVKELYKTEQYTVVIDPSQYSRKYLRAVPYSLIAYTDLRRTVSDITIYFLANNEYHWYIHWLLYKHRELDGKAISIIHEPAMWMAVSSMCTLGKFGFSQKDLEYFARYEFGEDSSLFSKHNNMNLVDNIFRSTSLAATHIYDNSNLLIFHSWYAHNKFRLEKSRSYPSRTIPLSYLVMKHPSERKVATTERGKKKKWQTKKIFRVGVFGWVTPAKQIISLMRAFNDFYVGLSNDEKKMVSMHIVGQVINTRDFDPEGVAVSLTCSEAIEFHGYVDDLELARLIADSSIIYSLRFPSCGETSGPLQKANAYKVPVILSDYAAFSEEAAAEHITVNQRCQTEKIAESLAVYYYAWSTNNQSLFNKPQLHAWSTPAKNDVKNVLVTIGQTFNN